MNKFTLPITPPTVTSQTAGTRIGINKHTGRPFVYKSKEADAAVETYEKLLVFHKPRNPVSGPVELSVLFVFPYLASEPKKNRIRGLIWKTTKPDTDNMIKSFKDAMAGVRFFGQDAQVCDERVRKVFGESPRIEVAWRELPSLFLADCENPANLGGNHARTI